MYRESIEILPGGFEDWSIQGARPDFPFVLVEGNLGVPKKVLYRLYLAAVAKFTRADTKQPDSDIRVVVSSTSVIIFANPAHQTALNARKRLILRGVLSAELEIAFIDLLLRGSSECAKQSIIWDHRRWIFQRLYGTTASAPSWRLQALGGWLGPLEWETIPQIPTNVARKELGLVRHACEIYPRNYHGWNHWRYVMNVTYVHLYEGREWEELVDEEFREMLKWVEGHVSDYTSMHHLRDFVERFGLEKTVLIQQFSELRAFYASHEAVEKYGRLLGVDKIKNSGT